MGDDNATQQWDAYCSTGQIAGAPGAVLVGGGGVNTIIGSGGRNVIVSGPDHPSTGTGNYIYGGPVGDLIAAVPGSSTIYPGAGTNVIDTRSPYVDYVYCVAGDKNTTVYAEHYDVIRNCAHVIYGNPSAAISTTPALSPATMSSASRTMNADIARGEVEARRVGRATAVHRAKRRTHRKHVTKHAHR
jgi:hypothetical protein